MSLYRFRIIDKNSHVIAGQFSYCKDDETAREHARLLAIETKHVVQILNGDRQVILTENVA